jgi:hypothetical protein
LEDSGLGTAAFLLPLPLVAMHFTDEANWHDVAVGDLPADASPEIAAQ